ncbi:30S ribosomal protein S20 [Candidatus Bipolaricaulota bacterium]|nr:30S ribosomal protein S20 [Candidatus Bipolaricaulota bacterium]
MPNIRSAEKRLRQSEKRRGMNRARKSAFRRIVKDLKAQVASGDRDAAQALIPALNKALDKAAKHNAIHKNKANRIKSQWARRVQAL